MGFVTCTFASGQIKEDEMGGTYRTPEIKDTQNVPLKKNKERDYRRVGTGIILKS
jgi:hypothetical protein